MLTFSEWLKEMFSPISAPSVTNRTPEAGAKLKVYTAFNTGEAKIPRWKRGILKQGSQDGDWR